MLYGTGTFREVFKVIRQSCTTTCQTAYQLNIHVHLGKVINVIATSNSEIGSDIAPCNHEEADTRLICMLFIVQSMVIAEF